MRYWIERGHARAGLPFGGEDVAAFDALDPALADTRNVMTFEWRPASVLFIDNTAVAHGREASDDDPAAPRLMGRVWLDELGRG